MDELQIKLERLSQLKAEEAKFSPIKAEIEQLRIDIQYAMQQVHSKRTEPVAGIYAVREERKTLVVSDEAALSDWLDDNVMDPMFYYRPNPASLRELAAERLRDTGELIPGIEEAATETISIRRAKACPRSELPP